MATVSQTVEANAIERFLCRSVDRNQMTSSSTSNDAILIHVGKTGGVAESTRASCNNMEIREIGTFENFQ